ncbi:MAG TPA: serine/threonine-protein kinase, partial [Micromonosporaceae bacterium]|nr:serine/threonine-protein kinase [Micromonosporaceae bacterium]
MSRLGNLTTLAGRYRLVERLGIGGMSVVWRGYDEVLGRQVAIKVLAPTLASEGGFRHRLRAEAQAAARLCHPHITNVYDYGEAEGSGGTTVPYVVMELIDGEPMSSRLRRGGAMPWREAVTACAEVASALAVAHARGVVHRDVTPNNVMLTDSGAKMVDF